MTSSPARSPLAATPDSDTRQAPYVALVGGANLDISALSHAQPLMGDSNSGRIVCSPGGVARNVAENLLRLGLDARLLSVLGDDAFGLVLRQAAAAIGLNLSACSTLPGARTATYLSLHGVDGDMGVAVNDMGILEQLTPALLQPHTALVRGAAALVVDCNVRPDVLDWLCHEIQHPVLFAEAVSVAKCHKLLPVLDRLHTLKANRMEAQALSGLPIADMADMAHMPTTPDATGNGDRAANQASMEQAQAAALHLHQRGVRQVVISLGVQGVVWCDDQGHTGHRSVQPITMASATGAGDALLSGLVYGHLQGLPLAQAVRFAMACAELSLSSTFANSPDLSVASVQAHLEHHTA